MTIESNNCGKEEYIIISCPHCHNIIYIDKKEFNCKIFRHGVYKKTLKQIDPHSPKNMCDYLVKNNLIYGCGKPFKLIPNGNSIIVEMCDYI